MKSKIVGFYFAVETILDYNYIGDYNIRDM